MGDRGPLGIRSVDVVVALRVCSLGGSHGSDDGYLIGMLGGAFKVLAKLNSVNLSRDCFDRTTILGGCIRLGVKSIDMSHASSHVQVDDILSFSVRLLDGFGCFRRREPRGGSST